MEVFVLKVGTRGRIVIPKRIRDELRIKDKVRLVFDKEKKRLVILPSPYKQVKLSELE